MRTIAGQRSVPAAIARAAVLPVGGDTSDVVRLSGGTNKGAYRARGGHERPRGAHAVRGVVRIADSTVTVVQIRGLRDPSGKSDTPARRAQAGRIADLVSGLRQSGDDMSVCGDFNLLPDSETFEVLAGIGLTDLGGDANTRTSHYRKSVWHASYILVAAPSKVQQFEIMTAPGVSDRS